MAHAPSVPIAQAVPLEPRRPLDPNVAVLTLCIVLQLSGVWRFLLLLSAVLILDRRVNLTALVRMGLSAVRRVARCLPEPPRAMAAAMAPPDLLVLAARALGELLDNLLEE